MGSGRLASIVLIAVVIAVAAAVGWSAISEEADEPTYASGDLTVVGSLAGGDVSLFSVDGTAVMAVGSDDAEWTVVDLEGPAYQLNVLTGQYERRGTGLSVETSTGSALTIGDPGRYLVTLTASGSSYRGTVTLDGDITSSFQWNQTLYGGLVSYDYEIDFTYRFSDVLSYQEDPSAVRHESSALQASRFAVVDEDMESLAGLLEKEYRSVRPWAAVGGQDYADYLLSFVQCCIAYPDPIVYENGRYVKDTEDGSPDLTLYGAREYWAYPMETLFHATGDCEDTSFLAAALFSAAGYPAGVMTLTDHMIAAIGLDSFRSRGTSDTARIASIEDGGATLYLCETTTDRFMYVGYLSNGYADDAESNGALSMVEAAEDDPDDGLPEGFALDSGVLSYGSSIQWHVFDLMEPYQTVVNAETVVYHGYDETGSSIVLSPGLYRITASGLTFEVAVPGSIERTASWTYDLDGTKNEVTVSYAIDVLDLRYERGIAEEFNSDGHQRLFSELTSFARVSSTVLSIERSLESEFVRIGGDITDAQAYADFIASFPAVAITYPSPRSAQDRGIYGVDEYWAMPLQTLCLMKGDCEDTSALVCALYLAAGYLPAIGGTHGHVFAGVHLESFETVSDERLNELNSTRSYRMVALAPVEGSCDGPVAEYLFYAVETSHDVQVPVGYMSATIVAGTTSWGAPGFYPCIGR